MVTWDIEGFITITDGIKEMIKVKGTAVAPAELEDLLLRCPTVEDITVDTIPNDYTGQHTKAHVVLKPGILLTTFSLVHQITGFVTELDLLQETPKSASGKMLRRVLRELGLENNRKRSYMVDREEVQSNL
ncbi:uncharacterized protein N7498_006018 [Penicillium cinerascens]|uniref:AMP-binding enzyme C-terminal domain-containing protein n=1 Tax=Penicillium cinerascens TaxID=70096 RepID=A0A9W9MHG4_9EURO|nr:uncharacterized protein N7498_006018 [Penicillium cinerascens]KAJ5201355.1 hypothetical protein N7498_006018 [Penicillium cinerascens]